MSVPLRKSYQPASDPVKKSDLEGFYTIDDTWTRAVATAIDYNLLTRLVAPNIAIGTAGTGSVNVTLSTHEPDTKYQIHIEPSWNTTWWITAKTVTGFTVNFGTASPAGASFSWARLR